MTEKNNFVRELAKLLERADISTHSKYITAKQIELMYGVPSKTVLNRSNLPPTHRRYIPSVRLKGGRKKYFERKVVERFFELQSEGGTDEN
jgi:hypothetical protein